MTPRQAELDARTDSADPTALSATAMVGGIPLAVRLLRQLARRGWTGARVIVSDEDDANLVRRALVRHPVPPALAVDVATTPTGRAERMLDARAIYRIGDLPGPGVDDSPAGVEPIARVRTRADVAAAERALFAQIRKSVDLDGVISYYVIRPVARRVTRALLSTRVAPNHVTFCALLCALTAALLAASGDLRAAGAAGALYWLGGALDHVDGELARLRLQSSKLGEWLDAMTDEISTFSLLTGLGVGLWRGGAGAEWLWIGPGGSAIGALAVARLYVDLHRMRLPIDTAQFPWFFAQSSEPRPPAAAAASGQARSVAGRILYGIGFLVRRDANVTGVAALLLLGWRELAAALVAAGAAIGAIVTLTHYIVMAMRRSRPRLLG